MSYVDITLRQRLCDAKAIRDYLNDAERQLPRNVPNAQVHVWLEHIARQIDEAAARSSSPPKGAA
jgi:hypothetical protein